MFEYLEKMGLESNVNTDPIDKEFDEIELEIIGCESAADLALSLLDFSLESEIASIGFNKVLIADTVANKGLENVEFNDLINQLEMTKRFEAGTEGVKETAKAGWYKVKAVFMALINAAIVGYKKFMALFATTDKMYVKIKDKATKVKTKWDGHKFPDASEKKFDTPVKNILSGLAGIATILTGNSTDGNITKFLDLGKGGLNGFIDAVEKGTALDESVLDAGKDKEKSEKKDIKDNASSLVADAKKKEEMGFTDFKKSCKSVLDKIEETSKDLAAAKLFEKCKTAVDAMEKIKSEISKIKGDEVNDKLGSEDKKQNLMKSAAKHVHVFARYPQMMAIRAKAYSTLASMGFNEISKCMGVSK